MSSPGWDCTGGYIELRKIPRLFEGVYSVPSVVLLCSPQAFEAHAPGMTGNKNWKTERKKSVPVTKYATYTEAGFPSSSEWFRCSFHQAIEGVRGVRLACQTN